MADVVGLFPVPTIFKSTPTEQENLLVHVPCPTFTLDQLLIEIATSIEEGGEKMKSPNTVQLFLLRGKETIAFGRQSSSHAALSFVTGEYFTKETTLLVNVCLPSATRGFHIGEVRSKTNKTTTTGTPVIKTTPVITTTATTVGTSTLVKNETNGAEDKVITKLSKMVRGTGAFKAMSSEKLGKEIQKLASVVKKQEDGAKKKEQFEALAASVEKGGASNLDARKEIMDWFRKVYPTSRQPWIPKKHLETDGDAAPTAAVSEEEEEDDDEEEEDEEDSVRGDSVTQNLDRSPEKTKKHTTTVAPKPVKKSLLPPGVKQAKDDLDALLCEASVWEDADAFDERIAAITSGIKGFDAAVKLRESLKNSRENVRANSKLLGRESWCRDLVRSILQEYPTAFGETFLGVPHYDPVHRSETPPPTSAPQKHAKSQEPQAKRSKVTSSQDDNSKNDESSKKSSSKMQPPFKNR